MFKRIVPILTVALAASACASFPPPTNQVASSLASVRGAEELGAAAVPQAALQLQLAREQIKQAKQLLADGDNEQAHYMALRAGNDAELAISLVRENNARGEKAKANDRVETAANQETP